MEENPAERQFIISPQPEEEKPKDDTADLFTVDSEELTDTEDVVAVDIEKDILDADEDGSLDSLTTVTEEDAMGDEMYGQSPLDTSDVQERKKRAQLAKRPVYPTAPSPQIGRLNI